MKAQAAKTTSPRMVSVDVLRGLSIFSIIGLDGIAWSLKDMSKGKGPIVETAGGILGDQFGHVSWEGLRYYDFIFPLLIVVTGVSIVLSLTRLVERDGKARAHVRVLRRSLLLFALGLVFYGGASSLWPDIRLLGVLQRIALCYLVASLLFLNGGLRGLAVAFVTLLVGYWALMTFVPVPGVGAGSYEIKANLSNWIDAQYLPGMKWNGTWDPEGLLSTLPAIGTCLIGVFAGLLLIDPRPTPQQKSAWLVAAGIALIAVGYLWSLQFPVIKSIWTSSFVLVTGGWSLMLLGVLHQVMDVWSWRRGTTFLVWIGANAITLYFLNSIVSFEQLAKRLVGGDVANFFDAHVTPGTGRLLGYAVGVTLAISLAGYLYRRKIFLRV